MDKHTMDKHTILKEKFGFDSFRPGQEEIIDAVMDTSQKGVLVVMPTGAGKSLLFQLPALLFGDLCIVVSPLIALMKDQVDALQSKGINAAVYNSSLSDEEKRQVVSELNFGIIEILYVAAERFQDDFFTEMLSNLNVALFAIDEAHAISQFSDFRPAYAQLSKAIRKIKPKQIVALTATSTPRISKDIIKQLNLTNPKIFIKSFYRSNLIFEVKHSGKAIFEEVIDEILEFQEKGISCGIIYTATKKDAEQLSLILTDEKYGVKSIVYHGGMSESKRKKAQDQWMQEDTLMIATSAFGLGVDKKNTDFVINLGLTDSIESFAQMAGRAGRGGQEAYCKLYVNLKKDIWLQNFFIDMTCPPKKVVKEFWAWINNKAEKNSTIIMTQEQMGDRSGIQNGLVGGCISILKQTGLVDTIKPGEYSVNYHENPDTAPINYQLIEEKRRIKIDKLNDIIEFVNDSKECHQLKLMRYFGDLSRTERCGKCNNCLTSHRI